MKIDWKNVRLIAFDFDGVMTDNAVYILEDGREAVRCSRGDGMGIELVRKQTDVMLCVISKEKNPVVSARCKKLQIKCIQGCEDKVTALEDELKAQGLSLQDAAFVGNDVNDIPCLQIVGNPVVVADAETSVVPYAKYVTKGKGGNGAVREICNLILESRGIL